MNRRDRLVGMLTVLCDGLAPVVDDLLAGDVPQEQLDALADRFQMVADELRAVHPTTDDVERSTCPRLNHRPRIERRWKS